jgi:hypothetical protein
MKELKNSRAHARGSMLWGFLLVILGLFAMMTPAVPALRRPSCWVRCC